MPFDADLISAVLAGDRALYAELVRRHQRMVLAMAWQTLGDYHAAEDAAQDAFVAAYENLGALRDPGSFGAWVLKIARREAIRVAQRRGTVQAIDAAVDPPASDNATPLDEDLQRLLAAVAKLPAHERVVVVLHYLEGHNVQTIAEMTGRPLGTVTKQLSRAVQRLRRILVEVKQ